MLKNDEKEVLIMNKPVIAIVPLYDQERDSLWMLPGYMEGIIEAGGIPVMLSLVNDEESLKVTANHFDGFIFAGGDDLDPRLYHQEKEDYCGKLCVERDSMEPGLLKYVLEANKPVLGICRGIQLLNVCLGGTLYQDLDQQYHPTCVHRQPAPYDQPSHQVKIIDETPLKRILQQDTLMVNSCHHQAIKELSSSLKVMAYSDDGLVEAVYMPNKRYVIGYQWHPEMIYKKSKDHQKLFFDFVENCKK